MKRSAFSKRFRHGLIVGLAGVTALALAGCTGGGDGGGSTGGGDEAGEVVFVDVIGTNPAHLNPQLVQDAAVQMPMSGVYDTLIVVDKNYDVHPSLAKSWDISDEGRTITFELEEGVKWHDGEPFTSHDVKYNIEEIFQLTTNAAPLVQRVESVEAPDDTTVVVHLTEAFGPWVAGLATQEILPAHLYEGTDVVTNEANLNPVGTGPFVFSEFINGDRVEVVKNSDYWGTPANIDRIVYKIMPDANARTLALQAGEVDRLVATYIVPSQLETLGQDPNLELTSSGLQPNNIMFFMNTRQAPFDNADVRKAVYSAINRDAIGENAYSGTAYAPEGLIPREVAWAFDDSIDFNEVFAYDPDAARAAIEAAGASGMSFTITIPSGFAAIAASADIIKSNLADIGIEVSVISLDLNVFIQTVYTDNNFDAAIMTGGIYEDPSLGIPRQYRCNPTNTTFVNPTGMCDEELEGYFNAAASATDPADRAAEFSKANHRLAEVLHAVPLVWELPTSAYRSDRWNGIEEFTSNMSGNADWTVLSRK